jgi:hypothetical protein
MIDLDRPTPVDPFPTPIERLIADVNELRTEIGELQASVDRALHVMQAGAATQRWHSAAILVLCVAVAVVACR